MHGNVNVMSKHGSAERRGEGVTNANEIMKMNGVGLKCYIQVGKWSQKDNAGVFSGAGVTTRRLVLLV